ncbi:hypothetical protein, partial [Cupriavidus consociatus]|uniref:hypothetical protein n=1 Tax=Cupriavidus consociatus TaxID=2821357 RepID=UPI001AE3A5F8
ESRSSPGSYCAKPLDSVCCEGFLLFRILNFAARWLATMLARLVTCCRPLTLSCRFDDMLSAVEPLVPPCWAGHFLSERQKVTKKRVALAAGYQFGGVGGSGDGDCRSMWVVVRTCYAR